MEHRWSIGGTIMGPLVVDHWERGPIAYLVECLQFNTIFYERVFYLCTADGEVIHRP